MLEDMVESNIWGRIYHCPGILDGMVAHYETSNTHPYIYASMERVPSNGQSQAPNFDGVDGISESRNEAV